MTEKLTLKNSAQQLRDYIKTIPAYPEGKYDGKGIVICGGGKKLGTCAYVAVRILKHFQCQLPIQVYYLDDPTCDHVESDPRWIEIMQGLGVETISFEDVKKEYPHKRCWGWQTKPLAILSSKFREVISIDADNVPCVDPAFLFDTPEYKKTGALFWPDYGRLAEERPFWKVFGVDYRDEPEFESGQLVIDKARCWKEINLTNWICERGDHRTDADCNDFGFYDHGFGDKEMFHAAWLVTDKSFSMCPKGIHSLDGTMCQHDWEGRRIFQHRNMKKWSLNDNEKVGGFANENLCLGYIQELRDAWLREDLNLSPEDQHKTAELGGTRYEYFRCGHDHRTITFGRHGSITEGSASRESSYYCKNDQLYICGDDHRVTARLQRVPGQPFWVGRWLVAEQMPVLLEEIN